MPNSGEVQRNGGGIPNTPIDIGDFESFGAVFWVAMRRSDYDEVPTYCAVDEKASPRRTRDFSVSEGGAEPSEAEEATDPEERTLATYSGLPPHIRDSLGRYDKIPTSTALPTMWMGAENDFIHIHGATSEWKKPLRRVKMPDAVLHILHYKGRMFTALANGSIAVFQRAEDGTWSDAGYHVIQFGNATSSVCHLTLVGDRIWAAYRNCVVVINPEEIKIEGAFVAHPRRDSQVRDVVSVGDGVWLSVRLDSTIRLYHAQTYQHLQDVDIEPFVVKMLGTRLDVLHLRITSLSALNKRLWIGTGTGIIISIPFSQGASKVEVEDKRASSDEPRGPGGLVRVYAGDASKADANSAVPYCNTTNAQLSFHGHKDAVRFFMSMPSDEISAPDASAVEVRKLLMMSGGDGYIDFRLGEDDDTEANVGEQVRVRDMSHLIVWEMECRSPSAADAT
ncbi:Protein UNC-16 c [Aphelenchoides avenae]|nr:Protein UNC-16 c [Aphelenchus avenae]